MIKLTEKQATINFDKLKFLLLSSDNELNKKNLENFASTLEPKFLDSRVSMIGNRIHMASFPRSGNSFLRKFIEQITGVITGSDFHIRDALNLQHAGLLGEHTFGDDSIWITKSHYPYMHQGHARFEADKRICIVRNPLDVIPSFLSLFYILSHVAVPKKAWNTFKCWESHATYFTN